MNIIPIAATAAAAVLAALAACPGASIKRGAGARGPRAQAVPM